MAMSACWIHSNIDYSSYRYVFFKQYYRAQLNLCMCTASLIALQQTQLDLQQSSFRFWMLSNMLDTTLVQMQVLLVSLTAVV